MVKNYLKETFEICQELLDQDFAKEHKRYIQKRVNDFEDFKFGFFPSSCNINILLKRINKNKLIYHKLIYPIRVETHINVNNKFMSFFENHQLIMPYYDAYGNIVSLVGRSIDNDILRKEKGIDKYKNTIFEKSYHLFNFNLAKEHILNEDCVFVVEGQFDAISAYKAGLKNTVALGCSTMSYNQLALILRYTKNIILVLDNDDGGRSGREKISKFKDYANISYFDDFPKICKDIDDFFSNADINDFKSYPFKPIC